MSQQSTDQEMKTIRRVIDALTALNPPQRERVLRYVNERINEPPALPQQPTLPGVTGAP